jgi:hypothetical protein
MTYQRPKTEQRNWKGRVPKSKWTHADQDQNDHSQPHCCGVCEHSPGGEQQRGMV